MKDHGLRVFAALMALTMVVVLNGCLVATEDTVITPEIISAFQGTYKVDPYMQKNRPRSVAVLPFYDRSGSKDGAEAVRRGFYNHFSSLPFRDLELYRVDELLAKAGLTDVQEILKTSPQKLGEILSVDAVVFGEISNFDKLFAVVYSQVSVGAELRMYETKTGRFLWSGQHVVRIHEGGLSTTPIGIIATVVATAMNVRDIQLLRACDDLFRDMVKTIPAPPLAEASRPPVISLLVQDTKNLPKKAGDEISVVMQGTPKMRASFDIGQFKKGIEMLEEAQTPGVYVGRYRVVPGDNVSAAMITGRLTDDAGNSAQWVDALGLVTIDTSPPPPPAGLKTVGRDRLVLLAWQGSPAPDLAGYRLYRSLTPLTGYEPLAATEFTQHRDSGLVNGRHYYYRVTAVDKAGNESEPTAAVAGLPVAPGPTLVQGAIEADATWYAGAGPYVLTGDVVVRDKALLKIEPGTEILSQGGGLVIEGRLLAEGDNERLISFDGAGGTGGWAGISFVNVKGQENVLKFVRIRKAKVAVSCEASSPVIESSEMSENETAIAVRGAFSAPTIKGNTIHKNRGQAVVVSEGAKPLLTGNKIQDNAAEGIVVRSAAPVIRGNTVTRNIGGILAFGVQATITENNITDNGPFDLAGERQGEALAARGNWWGTVKGLEVLSRIRGKVDFSPILDAPYPAGRPKELPILTSPLSGVIKTDAFLTLAHSPYQLKADLTVDDGAVLHIEPGVVVSYDRGTSIVVADGGVVARGTKELPIVFTASASSPVPGSYGSAVRWTKETKVGSIISYCVVRYATTAFDVYHGSPEISFCHIAESSQAGVYCRNAAAPQLSFNTFEKNLGEGGVKAVGMAGPLLRHNNFLGNSVALQAFSSLYIDARYNWWGGSPPDSSAVWGDLEKGINIKPWLEEPHRGAFRPGN